MKTAKPRTNKKTTHSTNRAAAPKSTNLKVIAFMLKTAWRKRKRVFVAFFLQFASFVFTNIQTILLPKFMLDELVVLYNSFSADQINAVLQSHNFFMLIFYVALIVSLGFVGGIINNTANLIFGNSDEWFEEYFNEQIVIKTMSLDFELTEDPTTLDKLNKARDGIAWYSGNVHGILDQFFSIISNIIVLLGVVFIIIVKAPLIIPLQLVSLAVNFFLNKKANRIQIENWLKLSKNNRAFGYLLWDICQPYNGKDIRLYDSSELFHLKGKAYLEEQKTVYKQQNRDLARCYIPIELIQQLNKIFAYAYVGIKALKKVLSIGDFSMCTASASTLYNCITQISFRVQEIQKRCTYAAEYIEYMELPSVKAQGEKPLAADYDKSTHVIEFKNVSFKYPKSESFVLQNVNLTIPGGQHLAVVGLNGAGKTTLIKLLCRLYDVTSGEILIDGVNIKSYRDDEYKKLFAVVFQDFQLFAFTLKENILLGETETDANAQKIRRILQQVGLYDDVQKYDEKENVYVDKRFEEKGTEFSGGQKQKLAIARALYKNAPVVIMDEPTAALDPVAEEEIYNQFNTNLSGGKTAIYISHRLSSCKFCDKIAVFSDKTIREYGSHKELMQIDGGIYNTMFTTQARQYR